MRRILPFLVLVTLVSALSVGVAWARTGDVPGLERAASATVSTAPPAPFRLPSTAAPARDVDAGSSVHGYVTSKRLSAILEAEEADVAEPAAAAPGTIRVTARVLPTVTIQLDGDGELASIITNTPERDARRVLFTVSGGDLDAATWADVRAALGDARGGTGTVWAA